jgi:hypothetical protein
VPEWGCLRLQAWLPTLEYLRHWLQPISSRSLQLIAWDR